MRQLDRARKRAERARLEQVDPGRERRAGQARTAAVRRLIATYEPEYRALWPPSEHAERRTTAKRRSPAVPDEGFFRAGRTRPGPNVHGPRTGPPSGSSRPGGSSRRPRWDIDAGITDRDVAALCWLGQQYAARSDVLRVLLGRLSPGSPASKASSARQPCATCSTAGRTAA